MGGQVVLTRMGQSVDGDYQRREQLEQRGVRQDDTNELNNGLRHGMWDRLFAVHHSFQLQQLSEHEHPAVLCSPDDGELLVRFDTFSLLSTVLRTSMLSFM